MFEKKTVQGAYFATAAFLFWGVVPVYFKWISHVSPLEIVSHRVIWSVVLLSAIISMTRSWATLRVSRRQLLTLVVTACLLSINWLLFIYAVLNNNIVETSLGYFINPLVSVLLGMIFLQERLRPLQWLAVSITAAGIAYQLLYYDRLPIIALSLAFSFGFYGLVRKNLALPALTGLMLETLIVCPLAILYLGWLAVKENLQFASVDLTTDLLLMTSGFVTSFPLLCFAAAITRLSLTAAGMFQYIAPTISLIIAVGWYGEPFGIDRIVTFSCIWLALLIFSAETIYHHRRLSRHAQLTSR
ncbi:MAG: EamA family transporter RarD [Gammaproteobacteria bacterium]|nr:EamA family transporter RarD [Gammaproteobacteria bacterium]